MKSSSQRDRLMALPMARATPLLPTHAFSEHSMLESRAWTLQEGLVSPRILHCHTGELRWLCLESSCSETTPARAQLKNDDDSVKSPDTGYSHSMDLKWALLRNEEAYLAMGRIRGWPTLFLDLMASPSEQSNSYSSVRAVMGWPRCHS